MSSKIFLQFVLLQLYLYNQGQPKQKGGLVNNSVVIIKQFMDMYRLCMTALMVNYIINADKAYVPILIFGILGVLIWIKNEIEKFHMLPLKKVVISKRYRREWVHNNPKIMLQKFLLDLEWTLLYAGIPLAWFCVEFAAINFTFESKLFYLVLLPDLYLRYLAYSDDQIQYF